MDVVLSSIKLAAIAQLTVLTTGAVGALCAYHGIFEVAVLKKMAKVCMLSVRLVVAADGFVRVIDSRAVCSFSPRYCFRRWRSPSSQSPRRRSSETMASALLSPPCM